MTYAEEAFTEYCETALWVGHDWSNENPEPLDDAYSADDIAEVAASAMFADVSAFILANQADIDAANIEAGQVGHDFWLTRNHHGAGFWDRGLGAIGDRLTNAAHAYGECDLYVGDDGQLYI